MITPIPYHIALEERLLTHAAFSLNTYPLGKPTLLDPGASLHVFNDRQRFRNYRLATYGEEVFAGDSGVRILNWGTVKVELRQLRRP